ncbi:MAG: putative zinc-binding protein, partial [Bryobacteraceae bacterium]
SCSGVADTAEIGDRAARLLNREGVARMSCLAGIGGNVQLIVDNVKKALLLLAIDGCDSDCARKVLERAGFEDFIHLRVTDLGMVKGETPVTEERIRQVADKAAELLGVEVA